MLIGVLSDTHDNMPAAAEAVRRLLEMGAARLVHCGDLVSPHMIDLLAGVESGFVFGNCDWDRPGLRRQAQALGVECWGTMGQFEADGRRIAVIHGDDAQAMRAAMGGGFDYVLSGHTHQRRDERVGRTRWINPGALHRTSVRTAALLDLCDDLLRSIEIESPRAR